MIYPKTELQYISAEIGYGVVATEFIPAGTITWALDKLDREFTPAQFKKMDPIYQEILDFYTFRNSKGNYVLCWDNGRYVNHSFNSNCISTAYDFEIAVRDIHIGEQLTDDYGYLNIERPFEGVDEGTERKIVYPDDLIRYAEVWDQQLVSVFNKIVELKQPLGSLLSEKTWSEIKQVVAGKKKMKSTRENFYDQTK